MKRVSWGIVSAAWCVFAACGGSASTGNDAAMGDASDGVVAGDVTGDVDDGGTSLDATVGDGQLGDVDTPDDAGPGETDGSVADGDVPAQTEDASSDMTMYGD